jgi:hypothetical protein
MRTSSTRWLYSRSPFRHRLSSCNVFQARELVFPALCLGFSSRRLRTPVYPDRNTQGNPCDMRHPQALCNHAILHFIREAPGKTGHQTRTKDEDGGHLEASAEEGSGLATISVVSSFGFEDLRTTLRKRSRLARTAVPSALLSLRRVHCWAAHEPVLANGSVVRLRGQALI